ncbi:MAG: transcription termination factor Rho, partial [Desulfotomaculaceae bacterium]|nr:transcription termination factor Rho [Desulfotomaculaceae bacterium]
EELLLSKDELEMIWQFRKATNGASSWDAMEMLMEQMKRSKTNHDLLHAFRHLRRAEAGAGGRTETGRKGAYTQGV